MAASRKGKQTATRPITRTPPESATQTEVVRGLRLCYLRRWPNFKGYGFDVKSDEKRHGFVIDRLDIRSPAELGGLAKDDRLLEVNGTSVEGKTHQEVLDLIKEDPVKVDLLVIDKETEQQFAKRHQVPSRKSSKVVYKTAPSEMPISPRGQKQVVVRKPPGASSGSTHIVAIQELSTEHIPPAPANVGKPGKKGKPVKPAKPKAAAKSKAAAKGGTKTNPAEVSKAEAELLKKFVLARAAENADADKGADDADQQPTDRFEASEDVIPGQARDEQVGTSGNAPSASPFSPGDLDYYGGAFVDDAATDAAGYYWPDEQYPWAPPPSPMYGQQPFSVPASPPYAPTVFPTSPISGAGAFMPYSLPGSPFWSPPMLPSMMPYQTPYMPLVPTPGFYGFPYVPPTYPDFTPYSAPFPRYPHSGGEANQREEPAGEGADMPRHQAGSSGSHKEAKKRKDKPAKSKAKDQTSPSARHHEHKPDKGP
ncbi:hypothetical protein HPB52_005998 [Rhipicephalus sanguineus]|uniref:PDZ domain-containing protein n=1 Tax=Rhipicephalus sanguineus TaxID=34632 RepID=A0A9D4PUY6_RHISA|nr:hypothetical protein HPB52_005998 [Rhipicephalus sanguineus]